MTTEEQYSIRPAAQADASGVSRLILDYGAEYNATQDNDTIQSQSAELLSRCLSESSCTAYVVVNPDVVGYVVVHWIPFICLKGTEGYISELLVNAGHRGQGVGQRLMAEIEREARSRACFRLMLNNFRAQESYKRGFYTKLGFVERDGVGNFVKALDKDS